MAMWGMIDESLLILVSNVMFSLGFVNVPSGDVALVLKLTYRLFNKRWVESCVS